MLQRDASDKTQPGRRIASFGQTGLGRVGQSRFTLGQATSTGRRDRPTLLSRITSLRPATGCGAIPCLGSSSYEYRNRRPMRQAQPNRPARKYYSQGTYLLGENRAAEAEICLRAALRLNPDDADVLNNLGTAVWEQGRAPEAMAYYLRAHQFKPTDFGILNNLGIALWDQGRPERAVTFYRRALEIEPGSFDTQMNLGVALSDLGSIR